MTDRLYSLLPAIYRVRDAEQGEPLRALAAVMEGVFEDLDEDIRALYENWFIETAEDWVVPYIGDLLRVGAVNPFSTATFSPRAYVANTLAYRRRKGTASVLEQLARDVTGWPARVSEFFELLVTSQFMNHIRLHSLATVDLTDANSLELVAGPFEKAAHTVDVGRISSGRGKYNIPNIGLHLWRLQAYPVKRGTAREIVGSPGGLTYTFHPLGLDAPLFNQPQTEDQITHLAEEINVPGRLRRRALFDELESFRQAQVDGGSFSRVFFSAAHPLIEVFVATLADPAALPEKVPDEQVKVCDLSDWRIPAATKEYFPSDDPTAGQLLPIAVAIDPVLGRLTFPSEAPPAKVQVGFSYGFSDDLGGGPYDRTESVEQRLAAAFGRGDVVQLPSDPTFQVGVTKDPRDTDSPLSPGELKSTLLEAIQEWNAIAQEDEYGLIAVMDSDTYVEQPLPDILIPARSRLAIVAADWPQIERPDGPAERIAGRITADAVRPHVRADLRVLGTAADEDPGELILHGLLVEGGITVVDGNLGGLLVAHSTLAPVDGGVTVEAGNSRLRVELERTICGPLFLPETIDELEVTDSILQAPEEPFSMSPPAVDPPFVLAGDPAGLEPGPETTLQRTTLFGAVYVREMTLVSEVIFTETAVAERLQKGCVRFSYVPAGSETPRRYRCQPDLALDGVEALAERDQIRLRLTPTFTSSRFGAPGYAQLARICAEEIRTGAEDGAEMGAFSSLKQPQREANLRVAFDEYLRFDLEAGTFFVT